MNILFVYPAYPDTFWSFKHALKFISRKASSPPLGLLTVASMMPDNMEKKLIDLNIDKLSDKDIVWADYVFVTAMSIQKESVIKVIDRCNKFNRKVVAGGPLFTTCPEDFPGVDYLVLNEGEITFPRFLEDMKKGELKRIYKSNQWADITKTPVPLWELIDMNKYATMCLQYSRGCPFNCEFCDVTTLFGRELRVKTKEQVIRELDSIYERKWRGGVFIVDDNFIGNKKYVKKEILPAMVEWSKQRGYPFSFNTQASINLSDDEELMQLMVQAGFQSVFVGIETPNEDSLAECGKLQNRNRDMVECVKKMQSNGLEVQGGFILGFDSDPPAIFERLIKFIQKSGIVTAMVGLLNAPKGSKLYKRLVEENRLLKDFSGDNTDYSMNFIPKMNHEYLVKGYKKVLKTIYSPKNYYDRIITLLKNMKPLHKKKFQYNPMYLKAFLRSIWHLGIKGKERLYYWKLLIWSMFKRPQFFPIAVTLAIYGFHFRKIFDL